MTQLTLAVALRDGASFTNYIAGPNLEALQAVRDFGDRGEKFIYLWGASGTGKTHLLHAACQRITAEGATPAYLPLAQAQEMSPELLEGMEHLALVCVDDIHAIAGQAVWEAALFNLYNRLRETNTRLIVTANAPPAELGLSLPDLRSRLASGLVLQLQGLDDERKLAALQLRAQGRGIDLPEEVGRFLLRRYPRDMAELFKLLQRLDDASLTTQRKLTIPFVRELIAEIN